jgi:hypothetical protein
MVDFMGTQNDFLSIVGIDQGLEPMGKAKDKID